MRTLAERIEYLEGQRGYVDITLAAASTNAVALVFPQAFAAAPHMQVTSNNTLMFPGVDTITTTGCNVRIRHISGSSVSGTYRVFWRAYPESV
jgi:hypothetical protein